MNTPRAKSIRLTQEEAFDLFLVGVSVGGDNGQADSTFAEIREHQRAIFDQRWSVMLAKVREVRARARRRKSK